ncbi:MAG: hypothetical protein COA36_10800 [Desulfotalea sp.]|nr:MAG: hypothetical protein COA36_10800 [Desulfotalea sp.]
MTHFIDNSEINALLFDHKRNGFALSAKNAKVLTFKDSDSNPIVAHYYVSEKKSPNIIFFPSAESPLEQFDKMASSYNQQGLNVLILSYRGDNGGSGISTLEEFYEDGRLLFEQAVAWLTDNEYVGGRFVMGQSLGAVLAIDVVERNPDMVKGLLLESGMGRTVDYLKNRGIETDNIPDLEEHGFCNLEKIEKIELATLIFHGAQDAWISIVEAETLQACCGARAKQFFVIPGAKHDFLYKSGEQLYFEMIKKFTDTLCGVNTWRQKRKKYLEAQER